MEERVPNVKLRNARINRNWTQQKVADGVGTIPLMVGRWERGEVFPSAYYRQRLCELFGMSLEELGLTAEEHRPHPSTETDREAHEADRETPQHTPADEMTPPDQQNERRGRLTILIGIALVLLVASAGAVYLISLTHPLAIKPGGGWMSPVGKTVKSKVYFAAYAYPTHQGEPAIDHVNFTIYWQGVDPRQWVPACTSYKPIKKDIFACTADLHALGAPAGEVRISFDVYDKQGNHNNAPNGVHTVTYSP
jgi:transcriptional regulator with XRE-family HTH domain